MRFAAGVFVALLVLAYFLFSPLATPYVRGKLQAMIAEQLNAELRMQRLTYVYPYGVHVHDAVLVATGTEGQSVELLKVPEMQIELAELPFGSGPLVVKKLLFKEPSVRLINTERGLVGRYGLVREMQGSAATTNPVSRRRFSEMFELRLVSIDGGTIVYEDRTEPGTAPLAWQGIRVKLATEPTTNPLYRFDFAADSGDVASLKAKGQFHIDDLELRVDSLGLSATADPERTESPAPAAVQQWLRAYGVAGAIDVKGTARMPLTDPRRAQFDLTTRLIDARVRPPQWGGQGIDHATLSVRCSDRPIASAHEATTRAPATRPVTTQLALPAGMLYVVMENAELQSADTVALLPKAAAIIDLGEQSWRLEDVGARVLLGDEKQALPKLVRGVVDKPQFYGTVEIAGRAAGRWGGGIEAKDAYRAELSVSAPSLITTDRRLLLTDVSFDLSATPGAVVIAEDAKDNRRGLRADFYGGKLAGEGKLVPGKPFRYDFRAVANDVDVRAFAEAWSRSGEAPMKASGRGTGVFTFGGAGPHDGAQGRVTLAQGLTGYGEFEVMDGDFYELPAISKIVSAVKPGNETGRVGQAAGVFRVAERKVHFEKAAVSAPVLGLQGTGSVTFDGQMDFRVVAAPLADWKRQLQKTRIPVLGDIGAELAGGVQKMLDTATGKLLYQFRVTGKASDPEVKTEPVPVLKENALKLFAQMLKVTKGDRLLEQLKGQK